MKGRVWASLMLAAAGAGALLFAGCGRRDEALKIAYVDNVAAAKAEQNLAVWNGVQRYADEEKAEVFREIPEGLDYTYTEASIDRVIAEGADVVVCFGKEMEQAVYDMQRIGRDVRFVLIEGTPRDEASGDEKIRANTTCVAPSDEQAGFLAGYAAVSEGYLNLSVLGAAHDETGMRHVTGFVQGAEQAARDAGPNVDAVQVVVRFLGGDVVSPALLTKTEEYYADGCQLIYAYSPGPEFLVATASENAGGKAIIGESPEELPMSAVIAVANIDYESAAFGALKRESAGELPGGRTVTLAVGEGGASLTLQTEQLRYFTASRYEALIARISAGRLEITAEDVTGGELEGFELEKVSVSISG